MPDFAVADPMEGLNAQAQSVPFAPSGIGESLGARFGSDITNSLVSKISAPIAEYQSEQGTVQQTGFFTLEQTQKPQQVITPAELEKTYPGTKFPQPMTPEIAQGYVKDQADERARQAILARNPSGVLRGVAGVGTDVIAGLLDPFNDAAFMVPVVGEARYANWLARAGESAGIFGRAGVTLGVGAARAEVGQGLISVGRLALDPDYTLGDAAHDELWAAPAGALLHGVHAFKGDILGARFAQEAEARAAVSSADTHDAATRVAAAQMANGDPVEVRPVFEAARTTRGDLMGTTSLTPTTLDNSIARAAGAPTQDEIRWNDEIAQAKTEAPPERVSEGQLSEASASIEQMRANGELTPEDEQALKPVEQAHEDAQSMAQAREQAATCLAAGEI